MRRLARRLFTSISRGDARFYLSAIACFGLGAALILCHLLFLPQQHGLAMTLIAVGIAVAILSGVIMAIPLLRWTKRTERAKAGRCPECGTAPEVNA